MASKIIYVMTMMVMLNLALLIFSCPPEGTTEGACSRFSPEENSTLIDLASDPTTVGSGFWNTLFGSGWGLLGIFGIVAAGSLLIGTTIFGRDITNYLYLALAIGLASTIYPAVRLWSIVNSLSVIGDSLARNIFAIVLVSGIVITVIFTVIDWGRGRE
jgi:hypothetical protein